MHTLIALIVKARNETQAVEKAWKTINKICNGGTLDFGTILDSKEDLARQYPDTYRWKFPSGHQCYEETKYRRVAPVCSVDGQNFIKESYSPDDYTPENNFQAATLNLMKTGYYVRDENYDHVSQSDRRLTSNEYYVVPIDIHS